MQPSTLEPRADQFSTLEQERREFVTPIPDILRSPAYTLEPVVGTPVAAGMVAAVYPTTYQQVPRFTDGIIEPSLSFTVLETVTLRPGRGAATEAKRVAVRVMSIPEKLLPAPIR